MKMNWNEYKSKIKQALDIFEFDERILEVIKNSIKNNQKIFVAGNGGSAALALHYVCDLSKGANPDWDKNFERYKAICLTDNIGYMTAISNDTSYDEVFRQQLINLASKNDILILISSSGNSPNIIKAAEYAKESGLITIGITGFKGGKLKEMCDHSAYVNFNSYELCEDVHGIFGHFLVCYLRESK
jgi:D-sedoheptulose 7-phosphate isomerase